MFNMSKQAKIKKEIKEEIYRDSDDKIYYNISIRDQSPTNNQTGLTLAEYEVERTKPILKIPSDYYLTIARFTVPATDIPIFIMPIQETQTNTLLDPYDVDLTPFSVTLTNVTAGTDFQKFVTYVTHSPNSPTPTPPPVPITYKAQDVSSYYYYVYTYTHMLTLINSALADAFDDLKTAQPDIPQTEAPFFIFNAETQLFSLIVPTSYNDIANPITIYINDKLLTYFGNIDGDFLGRNLTNGKDFRFFTEYNEDRAYTRPGQITGLYVDSSNDTYEIDDVAGNITHGLYDSISDLAAEMTASIPNYTVTAGTNTNILTISNDLAVNFKWEPLETGGLLGFTQSVYTGANSYTAELPPNFFPKYLERKQDYSSLSTWPSIVDLVITSGSLPIVKEWIQTNTQSGEPIFSATLTDFQPLLNEAGDGRSILEYYPQGPYRLINMDSKQPLRRFNFRVFWKDKQGRLFPVYIPYRQELSIKFLFLKKSTFTS